MRAFRHLSTALALALLLALGQYAGLVHALGHATEQLSHKPGTPAKIACDQCSTCAQLSGAAPSLPATHEPPSTRAAQAMAATESWPAAANVVFLSRAPPVQS